MLMGWYSEGWAMFMNIMLTLYITQGTGLAFIVMADVFTKVENHFLREFLKYFVLIKIKTQIPGAPIWSCLFFCMLLSLGLGSQIGIMEVGKIEKLSN